MFTGQLNSTAVELRTVGAAEPEIKHTSVPLKTEAEHSPKVIWLKKWLSDSFRHQAIS